MRELPGLWIARVRACLLTTIAVCAASTYRLGSYCTAQTGSPDLFSTSRVIVRLASYQDDYAWLSDGELVTWTLTGQIKAMMLSSSGTATEYDARTSGLISSLSAGIVDQAKSRYLLSIVPSPDEKKILFLQSQQGVGVISWRVASLNSEFEPLQTSVRVSTKCIPRWDDGSFYLCTEADSKSGATILRYPVSLLAKDGVPQVFNFVGYDLLKGHEYYRHQLDALSPRGKGYLFDWEAGTVNVPITLYTCDLGGPNELSRQRVEAFKGRSLWEVRVSPNASKVAWVTVSERRSLIGKSRSRDVTTGLWTSRVDGAERSLIATETRQISEREYGLDVRVGPSIKNVKWSPSGTKLAFQTYRKPEIWCIDVAGSVK